MQELAQEIDREDCHLNIRIFILKLLVNNSTLFKPYAAMWFEPICKFITYKQTGGKGFHYFLRDLTTLLIQWSDIATPHVASKAMKELCSKVINTLIKMSADKSKLIFNINIEIVATLLHNWRHLVTIDKVMIVKMLSTPETVEGGHIWKMTAI
jgi:DNA-dependent protein kinase catalytic subunit